MLSIDALPTGRIFAFHSRIEERLSAEPARSPTQLPLCPAPRRTNGRRADGNNNDVWGLKTHLPRADPIRIRPPPPLYGMAMTAGNHFHESAL